MKHILLYILVVMPFLFSGVASAQTNGTGDDKYNLKPNKPLVFTDGSKLSDTELHKSQSGTKVKIGLVQEVTLEYLPSRRALTGEMCAINKIVNTVDIGSGQKDLDHILNDDLDDYAEFISTAKVGVAYNPIVSVRDNSCYYAPGTTAGFSIVAGSGSTVLSLDVIGLMSITFYRDGEIVGHSAIKEGQSGSGVNLSLVNIPGTDQTAVNLTATAPEIFDEISLDYDGVTVGVGQLLRIKYAFVGDSKEFTITRNTENGSLAAGDGGQKYTPYGNFLIEKDGKNPNDIDSNTYEEEYRVDLDYAKGWNPVLLGLPFPIVQSQLENMLDAELGNTVPLTPIVGAVYMGGVKFMMEYKGDLKKEVYQPGTEVGFSYLNAAALDLSLGSSIQIILFDRNGNDVQTENLEAGVLALGVGEGGNGTAAIVAKVPFSGAEIRFYGGLKVDLGGMGVYYGFVREAPIIRHHCELNPSADMSLCAEQKSIQLNSNPDIAVTWSLGAFKDVNGDVRSNPASITSGGYVTGLSQPGQYEFIVTAADGCSDSVWINYDMFPEKVEYEGDPLTNDENAIEKGEYKISTSHNGETSGGLLAIDKLQDKENVVGDPTLSAKYSAGLKLADNNLIIGVKRIDGDIVNYKRDREDKMKEDTGNASLYEISKGNRVGFEFSNTIVGLNLGALHFMNIRLFKNGVEVYRHVVDESNAISAGLAGNDSQTRLRYSILVPWLDNDLNPIDFDEIQLWSSGVLDLGGGEIDIYYAFIERDVTEDEIDISKSCSTTLLTSSDTHTTIDYAAFGNPSLVKALGAMENISYFVDESLDTSLDDVHVAGVGARTTIPVKLGRTLDFRNELGIVMYNKTYAAGVDLGKGMVVYTMYRGEKTGDEFTDWNVLGAKVAGYGDKNIFYIHPTRLYDEVVIDFGQAAEVVGDTQFYGLIMRSDSDGDGIPDCQDPVSCVSQITIFDVDDVCEGDYITITAKGNSGNTYFLRFDDPTAPVKELEYIASTENDVNVRYEYTTGKAGRYQVTVLNSEKLPIAAMMYEVHPLQTEWKADAANTDWHNWNNWTNGTPYCCTDVIIPDNAKRYPVLSGANTKGDEFCCNRIFIRPGASIEGVNKLNYTKAWVQLELDPNCYNLLSAPLHEMVTGDMFIPESDKGVHNPEPFTDLKDETAVENRFNPTIYQRMWNSVVVKEQPWKGDLKDLTETEKLEEFNSTTWSHNFNHVNTPYEPMTGFSVWVDNGNLPDNTRFRFTFPKEHNVYNYFEDFSHAQIDRYENIKRVKEKIGRFIYEGTTYEDVKYNRKDGKYGTDRKLFPLDEGISISVTPETVSGSRYALLGNPFMSHLNARMIILENKDVIKGIMNPEGSLIYDSTKEEFTSTGAPELIPPMTSVFLIVNEDVPDAEITLTPDMILPETATAEEPGAQTRGIKVVAQAKGMTSSVAVLTESDITNPALIDSEVKTDFAIFSNADGVACDIVTAKSEVPLTIIADKDAEITLDFITSGVNRDDWTLFDKATGIEYPIDHQVTLPEGVGSSSGRFVMRSVSFSGVEMTAEDDGVYLEVNGNEVTVHALSDAITSLEVYDLSGAMIGMTKPEGKDVVRMTVPAGICIIRISSEGKTSSHKIAIR